MRAPPRRPRPLRTPLFAGLTLALVALAPTASLGQDTPTKYEFTLKKVELCANDACTPAEVLPDTTDQVIDLGSDVATPGQQVVAYASGAQVPPDFDFTHVRITFDRDFFAIADAGAAGGSGTQSDNLVDCNTTAGAVVQVSSATQEVAIVNANEAVGVQKFVIPDSFAGPGVTIDAGANTILFTGDFGQTFTTGPNFFISVSFDVLNKILFTPGADANNCDIRLGTPDIGIGIQGE